jgi:hypothetical protein
MELSVINVRDTAEVERAIAGYLIAPVLAAFEALDCCYWAATLTHR